MRARSLFQSSKSFPVTSRPPDLNLTFAILSCTPTKDLKTETEEPLQTPIHVGNGGERGWNDSGAKILTRRGLAVIGTKLRTQGCRPAAR